MPARPATIEPRPTEAFFARLAAGSDDPRLRRASGAVRFEVRDGPRTERWHVAVAEGGVSVSRGNHRADTIVRADRVVFDRLCSGETNLLAAYLRGEVTAEGELGLVLLLQRLFPTRPLPGGPDGSTT